MRWPPYTLQPIGQNSDKRLIALAEGVRFKSYPLIKCER